MGVTENIDVKDLGLDGHRSKDDKSMMLINM